MDSKLKLNIKKIKMLDVAYSLIAIIVLGGTDDTILAEKQIYIIFLFLIYSLKKSNSSIRKIESSNVKLVMTAVFVLIVQSFGLFYCLELRLTARFILYFIVYCVCIFFCLDDRSYLNLLNMIEFWAFVLSISIVVSSVMGSSFVTAFSFWLNNESRMLLDVGYGQYSGLVGDRAFASMAMFTGISLQLADIFSKRKIDLKNLIYVLAGIVGLFLTGKRIVLLMLAVGMAVALLISNGLRIKRIIMRVCVIVGLVSILVLYFVPNAQIILIRLLMSLSDTTYNGRTAFWNVAVEMFDKKPILGWGMGSYIPYNEKYGTGIRQYTHNMYLQLLSESGLLGTGLLLIFFAVFIYVTIRLLRYYEAEYLRENVSSECKLCYFSLMIQLGFLIYGITGYPYYNLQQGFLYAVCCGMILCLNKKRRSKNRAWREMK